MKAIRVSEYGGPSVLKLEEVATPEPAPNQGSASLTVLLFASDSDETAAMTRAMEDRRVAKLHEKCSFVKIGYRKDSPEVKRWNIVSAPTVLLLDPTKDFGPKAILERSSDRKNPRELKAFLAKGLSAIEKARR